MVDLSPELLRIAREKLAACAAKIDGFVCASATDLSMLRDKQFEHGLMMGPMYHLTQKKDRHAALMEFCRVIKDGGIGIISFFGSYGMLRLGIADMINRYRDIAEIERFLGPTSFEAVDLSGFTACHFSTPEEIGAELADAGLRVISHASAQGFAGGMRRDLENLFATCRGSFENVLAVAVRYCEDERFRDCGQHLHYVVKVG